MEFETLINRGNTADARHAPIEVKETNGEEENVQCPIKPIWEQSKENEAWM